MKRVLDVGKVPKGGKWTYINPEDSFAIEHLHIDELRNRARKYRRINNYPIGSQWDEQFEDNVCQQASDCDCVEIGVPTITSRIKTFASALVRSAKSGFKQVTAEEVARRMDVCGACPYYSGSHSIWKIACKKCGCTGLKLNMATEKCPLNKW